MGKIKDIEKQEDTNENDEKERAENEKVLHQH